MDDVTFFHAIAERLRCDERRAESLTAVVFGELRGRLTPKEAGDVEAQLPSRLRRLWRDAESAHPPRRMHRDEFVGRVRRGAVLPDEGEAERTVMAVFGALQRLLGSPRGTEGEAWDIFSVLPKDLKQLWLAAGAGEARHP